MVKYLALLVAALAVEAKWDFTPETTDQLKAGADLYCAGSWPGPPVKDWDVENIDDFSFVFSNKGSCNPEIAQWDVSKGTNFRGMFSFNTGLNQNLTSWEVQSTADRTGIFTGSCPANSTLVAPEFNRFNMETTMETIITDGLLFDRCECPEGTGFKDGECIDCETIDFRLQDNKCVPSCPTGSEIDGDECKCTNEYETLKDGKCVCEEGAYGEGENTCQECPEGTYKKKHTYEGTGSIEERCTCDGSYEVYDEELGECACDVGAYSKYGKDYAGYCKKCPWYMEAKEEDSSESYSDSEDYNPSKPGRGDIGERCQCTGYSGKKGKGKGKRYDYVNEIWDEDEEKCVCKEGNYGEGNGYCYACPYGMEARDSESSDEGATGTIEERCQCKYSYQEYNGDYGCSDKQESESSEEILCERGEFGRREGECRPCPAGSVANRGTVAGFGALKARCRCKQNKKFEGDECKRQRK